VLAGAGLGCVSRSAAAAEIHSGELRRISVPWLDLRRQITVLVHRARYLDGGSRSFLRYCGVRVADGWKK
jgi:DNA-binding transcriptional LysR family regulator